MGKLKEGGEVPVVLGFGIPGHHVEGYHAQGTWSLSGYETPETLKIEPEWEGLPVIDKRPAIETKRGHKHVFSGPMLGVKLAPGRCIDLYGTERELLDGEIPGGFWYVALDTYVEGWRKVGARIGRIIGQRIVWEA